MSVEETSKFFSDSLKKTFDKLGINTKPFYLLGHSFGGFIASEYALTYEEEIKHLILMSPVGIPRAPEYLREETFRENLDEESFLQYRGFEFVTSQWNEYHPPFFEVVRLGGRFIYPAVLSSI